MKFGPALMAVRRGKLQTIAEQATFRRVYNFVHNPIRPDASLPAMEVADQQTRDGEKWMHLRPQASDKKQPAAERMEYWFAMSQDPKRNGVRRYEGPVTEPGHEKEPLRCMATYQPANDKTIQPPVGATSSTEQGGGQSASPASAATAAIKPPPDGDAVKAGDAGRKIPAPNSKTLSLLDGKLTLDVPADFEREPAKKSDKKSLAKFARKDGAWGEVLRGTNGLTPEALPGYLKKRVEEYSKSFDWLPPDLHIEWLRKEIVTFNGREWADWRFVPMGKDSKV